MYKYGVRLSEEIQRVQLLLMKRKGDIKYIELKLYIGGWDIVGIGRIERNKVR